MIQQGLDQKVEFDWIGHYFRSKVRIWRRLYGLLSPTQWKTAVEVCEEYTQVYELSNYNCGILGLTLGEVKSRLRALSAVEGGKFVEQSIIRILRKDVNRLRLCEYKVYRRRER